MAIQLPNPGLGDGQTGDNEFVMWTKVKGNFSDSDNAASRTVGLESENLVLAKDVDKALSGSRSFYDSAASSGTYELEDVPVGTGVYDNTSGEFDWLPYRSAYYVQRIDVNNIRKVTATRRNTGELFTAVSFGSGAWSDWSKTYTTENTTTDGNGFVKAASPIVKVHNDKVVLNSDAERQNVTFKRDGTGDYTITTESGLSTDGWYIELPKDLNGNPKVAVTLSEVDGVISLKSYKRIFSMETFTFEPDLDNPLDIPDTRWIDLRLNEIPFEMPDEIQTEV